MSRDAVPSSAAACGAAGAVTIAVPTKDRLTSLRRCLEGLCAAAVPGGAVDVMVIDNSTGSAQATVAAVAAETSLAVHYILEPAGGVSRARNRALWEATGNLVGYVDDDCVVDPDYVRVLQSLTEDHTVDFWFGPIMLGDARDARIGVDEDLTDWTLSPRDLVRPGQAQSANLVVRRASALRIGGFDEELGPGARFRCEDLDFVARLLRAGGHGRHVSSLRITHFHGRRDRSKAHRVVERHNAVGIGAFAARQAAQGDLRYAQQRLRSIADLRGRYGRRVDLKVLEAAGFAAATAMSASRLIRDARCTKEGP